MSDADERAHCAAAADKVCDDRWLQGGCGIDGISDRDYFARVIANERADAASKARDDVPQCKCEHLIGQVEQVGKTLEGSCPVHEWRLVDRVVKARAAALEEAIATMESYAGGCDNYVRAGVLDHWGARGETTRVLIARIRSLLSGGGK